MDITKRGYMSADKEVTSVVIVQVNGLVPDEQHPSSAFNVKEFADEESAFDVDLDWAVEMVTTLGGVRNPMIFCTDMQYMKQRPDIPNIGSAEMIVWIVTSADTPVWAMVIRF
jgi:hypothetical protein